MFTVNIYLETEESSSSFYSFLCSFNPLFESILGMPGSSRKYPFDKTASIITPTDVYPHAKKTSPYLKSLKPKP